LKRDADILELIDLWWRYENHYQHTRGYPSTCASTRDWRASRQWDNLNGALDADADAAMAEHVGIMVAQLADPWRTAIHILGRNRATGSTVWTSPRLPADMDERASIVAIALDKLIAML
jgi:hypothetical protein